MNDEEIDYPEIPDDVPESMDDDEMQDLLERLDEDTDVADLMDKGVVADNSPPMNLEENKEKDIVHPPTAAELKPTDIRNVSALPIDDTAEPAPMQEAPIVDVRKQFEQLDAVSDEIVQGARADRQETQDIINVLKIEIDKAISNNVIPNRGFLDNIVKALEVKATINQTVVKIMDTKAKMLAATKAGTVIHNSNTAQAASHSSTDKSLMELLSQQPLGSEDDY